MSDPITLVRWRDAKTDPPGRATYPVWTDLGDAYYHPYTGEWLETPDTPYAMDPQPWVWAEDADPPGDDPLTTDDLWMLVDGDAIEQAVRAAVTGYRMAYTRDADGDGLDLLDALTPPGAETVALGVDERDHLIEEIVVRLLDRPAATRLRRAIENQEATRE